MTSPAKKILLSAVILFTLVTIVALSFRPSTPESQFQSLFTDLSTGLPEYQKLESFEQPVDAIKGDFFNSQLIQSETQLHRFAIKLGVPPKSLLSSGGVLVRANSTLNPRYPWVLKVRADTANPLDKTYRVRLEGRKAYD
jgi:hypothetical protein